MRIRKMLIGLLVAVAVLFFLSASTVSAQFCKGDFIYDGDVDARRCDNLFRTLWTGSIRSVPVRQTARPQWRRQGRLHHIMKEMMVIMKKGLDGRNQGLLIMEMVQ